MNRTASPAADDLIKKFRLANYSINSLPQVAPLCVHVMAGLTSLKTRHCANHETLNLNCPVCSKTLGAIAEKVQILPRSHSRIVCWVTGEVLDDSNPPMVLPNGFVYSEKAVRGMTNASNGNITCPRTSQNFHQHDLKKIFIV